MNKTLVRAKRRIETLEDEIADVAAQAGETLIRQMMIDFPEILRFVSGNGTLFFEIAPDVEVDLGEENDGKDLMGNARWEYRVFGVSEDFRGLWLSGLARLDEMKGRFAEMEEFLWEYVALLPQRLTREDL